VATTNDTLLKAGKSEFFTIRGSRQISVVQDTLPGSLSLVSIGSTIAWELSPTYINGLVLWLRSDLGISKDGVGLVSNWADQSGNGNDASQGANDKKPVWTANQINGYPSLVFDGADFLFTGLAMVQPATIFIVAQANGTLGQQYLFDGNDPADRWVIGYDLGVAPGAILSYAGDLGAFPQDLTYPDASSSYHVFESILNHAASTIKWDGQPEVVGDAGDNVISGINLGADRNVPPADGLHGGIAEFIIYNSALSATNREIVQTYLNKSRYAIY